VRAVRYHDAAEQELFTEITYLEGRAPNLGRRFLDEVLRAEKFIAEFPEGSQEVAPGIRKHPIRKFPYSLIYSVENDEIVIWAVAHGSRRPGYWITRLQ
jgi:plasmid stabilization system protein ParE